MIQTPIDCRKAIRKSNNVYVWVMLGDACETVKITKIQAYDLVFQIVRKYGEKCQSTDFGCESWGLVDENNNLTLGGL